MKRRNVALALMVGICGLTLAAHQLFSFQVDANGAKGMARAWIASSGSEMGISTEVQTKVSGLAELGIDQAAPVLAALYQNLSAIQSAGAGSSDLATRVDEVGKQLVALVDVKDRVVAEAGKTLAPRERAALIVKIGQRIHEHFHPTPAAVEGILSHLHSAHQAAIKEHLQLDDARAKALFGAMEPFGKQRREVREARHELFGQLESAVTANASDATLAKLLADWDKLTARMSDIARAQIAEAGKQLSLAEKVKLLAHVKQRTDHVLKIVALIGRFVPVKG